ncbi:T9SS type B sorting domain-containing protein [Labilibaculum antarcticum]|uniref:Ig-like domain-containing protein n=1 Tax=Labilibaculum antarcticum TaxID=1717717 RepID=A0A1Y1CK50_9BACT|nr:gliding motility-associated C-terminal domain-containing protein [Labilibaculum antarcticum]BAX80759.1 hypothetical protein ALGA_2437 [Labilibaculum antarcticum]
MRNGEISTQLMRVFKLVFIGLLFILPFRGMAQYDYEHYVPPFYNGSSNNQDIGTHTAVLSTNSSDYVNVQIYKGYDDLLNGSEPIKIKRGEPYEYVFKTPKGNSSGRVTSYPKDYDFPLTVVGALELNKPLDDQGLRFISTDAPFFVNIRHRSAVQGGSLTAKGTYAYGTEFRSGHVYTDAYKSAERRSHFISVMATEDTEVTFSEIKTPYLSEYDDVNGLYLKPHNGVPIVVNLTKGQSYIIGIDHNATVLGAGLPSFKDLGKDGWNSMNGTSITSTNPIVVNTGSWTSGPDDGQDMGFDQIVPVDQIRDQYIVMKGKGDVTTERPIVVATEDNTEVWVNGNQVNSGALLNAGDFLALDQFFDGAGVDNLFIDTKDKNVYVYQTLSGDTRVHGPTVGMNFIPPLTSLGVKEVTIPKADYLALEVVEQGIVTILAQKDANIKYDQTSLGVTTSYELSSADAVSVPGNTKWVSYTVTNLKGDYRFYSNKAINVAWVIRDGYVGAAGYYSGFTKAISKIIPDLNIHMDTELGVLCESYDDENIIVSIVGDPLPDFYEWYGADFTGEPNFPNGPLNVRIPDRDTSYNVIGYYMDESLNILYNGDFEESDMPEGFNSDYEFTDGNLTDQGTYAISTRTKDENTALELFAAIEDTDKTYVNRMLLAYSKDQGDVIYQVDEFPVEENLNYMFKLHGRLAIKDDADFFNQSLKVTINDETIIENFTINDISKWQFDLGLWRAGDSRKATIKIINNNLSSKDAIFALDSITFAQAVQDTAVFYAKVVPNFSYGSDGDVNFCEGVKDSLDVSNDEDTSWYDYSWYKKRVGELNVDGDPIYDELTDDELTFTGTKKPALVFVNPQEENEGDYRCVISFKLAYQDCASDNIVSVDFNVSVDKVATVIIDPKTITSFCSGSSTILNALVTGDAGTVKWYVGTDPYPVSVANPYTFNLPTGTYTVRCEVENGCGVSSDEVVIKVLSTPVLTSLTANDNLCVGQDIILTALATGDGVLTYDWKRGSETLTETGSVLNYPASILDRDVTFKVKVTSVYTVAEKTYTCANSLGMAVFDLDIYPLVEFDQPLVDATVCEGDNHSFSVVMKYPGDFYNYRWGKDGVDLLNNLSSQNLSNVSPAVDAGNYRVDVTNICNTAFSTANLIVTPEIKVNGFTIDKTGPFCTATDVTATFDVVDNGAVYIYQVTDGNGATNTITNPYTFTVDAANEGNWEFSVSGSCGTSISYLRTLNLYEDFGTLTVADVGACIGETITFEATVLDIPAASELHYAWTDNLGNPIGDDSDKLEVSNIQDDNLGTYAVVVTDQCTVSNSNSKTASGELTKEAVTSVESETTTVCVGEPFSTTITYLGSPEKIEWRFNDRINGTIVNTTETFSIPNVSLADAGIYYCTVTLGCGDAVIRRELKVNAHISLVDDITETIPVCVGEEVRLDVDVIGNPTDYTIKWTDGGGTVLGNGPSILLNSHSSPLTYTYKASVDGLCEDLSKTFKVDVHAKPTLSSLDNSIIECSGPISLDVVESGEHNGIVWWKDGSVITDGNADPTDFVLNPATSPSDDGAYIAKVESDYCGDAQVTINLDVRNTIVVTAQSPNPTVVCENEATNLFVTATGDDIKYNWYKSADLTKTTISDKSNLDLGNITLAKAGEYKCDLSNDLGCGDQTITVDVQVQEHAMVTNPENVVMCETDANPVFAVVGTGEAPVTYQWYDKDDNAIAGGTSNSLTVTSPVNGQSYYCVVSGSSCDDATSNKASLTILKNVTVTTDPLNRTISDGANVSFSVKASGEPAYTYKWYENSGSGWNLLSNGGQYSGVNLPTLQITGADKATFDGNQYQCEVISSGAVCASSATSNPATLTVTAVTKIAVQAVSTTVCFTDNATLSVEGASTGLTYTWYYKKGAGAYETAIGKDGMTVSLVGKISTITVPANDLDINNWKFQCVVSDGVSADQESNEVVVTVLKDITVTTVDQTYTPCVGQAFTMSVSATGDAIKYKWYKVGAESTILSTSASYNLGTISSAKEGTYKCEVYNNEHCTDQIRSFVVDVKELPTVTNPADVTMCANDVDPTFTVTGTAEGIVNYEWYDKDDILVVGATGNVLTVTSPVNGQSYYAVVSGDYCSTAKSNSASLTVLSEVSTTNPVSVTVADGGNASFKVTASGEPTYSYQWQEDSGSGFTDLSDGGEYSGTASLKLKITGALMVNGFDGNIYRCIIMSSSCSGVAVSLGATLTLNNIIKIKDQPIDQKVCETDPASFSVEGTAAVTSFVWRYNDGSGYVDADGALSMTVSTIGQISTLLIPNTATMNNWHFKCVLGVGGSYDDTYEAQLEVYEAINVTTAVNNSISKCEGESLVLSVATSAGSNIQYKWYESTSPGIVLSTSSSYDLGNVSLANEKTYKCDVYNDLGCGDVTISYTIDVQEDATVTNPTNQDVCASETNIEFEVTGTAEGTVNYEWFDKDDVLVGDAAKLIVTVPVHGQSYYCVVSGDACNDATSEIATLIVYEVVSIVDQPLDVTIPDGGNAIFTVKVAGEPDYTYQWQVLNGATWDDLSDIGNYTGTTSATLTITGADQLTYNGKQYRCEVTNLCNTIESAAATLTITSVAKISGQPDNMEACLGGAVDFEIIGSTTDLTYDWKYSTDGVVYTTVTIVPEIIVTTDANGSKLGIATTTLAMNDWTFRCIVSDGVSADETSGIASLNVVEPVGFDPIADENLCFGIEKQISLVNLSGTEPITFSWMNGTAEVSTTSTVSIGSGDNGNYQVTAGNGGVCPDKTDDFDVLHYSALSLDAWSNTDQVCIGQTEVLTVNVASKDALLPAETYQWYKDGSPVVTTSGLTLLATDKNQTGQYKVEVSDGCSTETVFGYVSVFESIAATNTWDAAKTICLGAELKLETKVTGDVTSYVWTKDGVGFTANSTYLKSAVVAGDAGEYVCTVSGNCGDDITYTIDVTVLEAPVITAGIDAIAEVCEGDPLVLGPIVVTGDHEDPVWTLNDNITQVTTTVNSLDLEAAEISEAGNYLVTVSNICGSDASLGNQIINPILTLAPIESQTVCAGNDVVFRANATGTSLNYQWIFDGVDQLVNSSELVLDASVVLPFDLNTSITYDVVCNITSTTGCGEYSQSTTLTVKPNTVLHATLKNVVKYVGESYTMKVEVSGVDLVFEWTHEPLVGSKVKLGETGPSITLTDIAMTDAGYYTCKIVGACGQRLASGKLIVKEPVTINSGLNALEEKCVGDPLSLSISASGQITSKQWSKDDVDIPGETNLNLFIAAVDLNDAGVYKCTIIGEGVSGGLVETTTVRVYSQTVLNASLSDITLCEGVSLDWTPDIDGTSTMKFEWTMGGVNIFDQKTLHYDALALSHEGNYEVQVTSMCGDVTTNANLEVTQLPVFVSATTGVDVCENESLVEFSVEYTGEKLKYQWRKDGVDLPGRTTQTLSVTNIQLSDDGDYDCRVYSTCGEEFSPVATLNVTAQLQVLSDMVDREVCAGEDVLFTADVVGNNVNYQWEFDGVDIVDVPGVISGANTSSLSIVSSQVAHSGYYTCIMSDDCTDYRSTKPTELVVHDLPNTAIYGRMLLCAKEDRVTYVLNQVNADVYSWNVDGGIFAGPEEGIKTRVTWEEISPGSLTVTIMDLVTGCTSKIDSAVVLNGLPVVNLTNLGSKGVCEKEFEITGGFPEGGIYWVNGISQTVFNPSDRGAGTYAVHYSYTDENGCSNVTPITNLDVDVLPVVDITDDTSVGSCNPTPLTAKTDEGNIQWFKIQDNNRVLPDNLDNPNSMNPIFTPGKSQVLLAMVKDEHGCEGIDLLNLSVAPLPIVTTINDTTVGQCNQLVLQTDIVGDQDVINWTNPDHLDHSDVRSPKIIDAPEGTHTYAISVTDLYGCDASGEVTVTILADPTLDEDKFGCEGVQYEVDITGMQNPVWNDKDTSPIRTIGTPGKYLLEVSNEYGCGDEQLFVINPIPNLGLKDTLVFEGQTVTFALNLPSEYEAYLFEWQDGSIGRRFEVSETGTYKLKVEDNLGCVAIDSAYVEVKPVGIESANAFLPLSDDGINDMFYLGDGNLGMGANADERFSIIEDFEMYVYDRWGELLFKTKEQGYNGGWNGQYKGKLCPTGAYVWIVFINGELTNKGTFMLVR